MQPSIQLVSGEMFDFTNPDPKVITIEVIAHALANQCRFNGHCREFYSVAQHSCLVSEAVLPEFAKEALLHDAAEAFMGDMVRPLKALLPEYRAYENIVEQVIAEKFGLPFPMSPVIKVADLVLLATEQRDLLSIGVSPWASLKGVEPLPFKIHPIPAHAAKIRFMDRWHQINDWKY